MTAAKRTTFKEPPSTWNLRALWVMAFAHGASDFFSGMVPLLIFTVITAHRLSPVYQGLLGFLWYLTSSIVQPFFGAYSDRRGQWWFLPAGVALTASAVSLAGFAPNLGVLAALIVLGGLGSAIMHPEAGKYSAMLSGARKAGGISIFQIGGQVGYALGPAIIGHLIDQRDTHGSIFMLIPGAIAIVMLFAIMPRVHRAAQRHHQSEKHAAAAHITDYGGVAAIVSATAIKYLVGSAFMTYLPNLLVAKGATLAQAGDVNTLYLMAGAGGLYLGGWLADRYGPILISIGSLLLAVPCLLGFFVSGPYLAAAALMLAGIALNAQSAPGVTIVQRLMPRRLGTALGLMNGVAFGIGSALVVVVGAAIARVGATAALQTVSTLPVVCALLYGVMARGQRAASSNVVASGSNP